MIRVVPMVVDLVLVLVFALIGRLSHGLDAIGILVTAWPFLAACAVAWVIISAIGDHGHGVRPGLIAWLVTWLGGLAIRIVSGDTAEWSFMIVAGSFLALFLLGWRLVRHLVVRWRAA